MVLLRDTPTKSWRQLPLHITQQKPPHPLPITGCSLPNSGGSRPKEVLSPKIAAEVSTGLFQAVPFSFLPDYSRNLIYSNIALQATPLLLLPPDGDPTHWKFFLESGGYFNVTHPVGKPSKVNDISFQKRQQILLFVLPILNAENGPGPDEWRLGWLSTQVQFHLAVRRLRAEFPSAPRDLWESCLPPKSSNYYEFDTLLLMLCSSMIPDSRLVPVMKTISPNTWLLLNLF